MISEFKALQKHQLTKHDDYNYIFFYFRIYTSAILNRTEPAHELGSLWSQTDRTVNAFAVHWTGRVKNHYGSEPNRTGTGQNHALKRWSTSFLTSTTVFCWRRMLFCLAYLWKLHYVFVLSSHHTTTQVTLSSYILCKINHNNYM